MTILNVGATEFKKEIEEGLVLVDFWAPWCGPCKMISPVLEELDAELGNQVKIIKVNVDEEGSVASEYGIMSIPTMLLFKDGKKVNKTAGYQPKESLVEFIDQHK